MEEQHTIPPLFVRRKRNRLILLLIWAAVSGFLDGAVSVDWETAILLLDAIVFAILVIQWTYFDAAELGFRLSRYFIPLMVICPGPILVMPVYFIKSRGWRRGLAACGLALAFMLLQFGISFAVLFLATQLVWSN